VTDEAEREQITRYLRSLGATDEEIEEVFRTGSVGGLALELVLVGDAEVVPFAEAARRAGVPFEDAARYWRALGFPDPTPESPRLPADAVPALHLVMTAGRELVGDEAALALTRVLGASMARIAQAVVDVLRVQFEGPQLAAGVGYPEVVQRYATLAETVLPPFLDAVGALLRRHLVSAASATWSSDDEGATAQRDTLVGFVDMVGYTALTRAQPPRELARMIDRFEHLVTESAARGNGRVVKLIGDAAMFTADDMVDGCRIALRIVDGAGAAGLPPLRAGLAAGGAVSLHGDLYGDVVNLAARLVAVAPEGAVVASEEVRSRCGDAVAFEPLPPQSLKGFAATSNAYRACPP
jgi:adenylate cyclase